jgi:phage-related tail fiber protein
VSTGLAPSAATQLGGVYSFAATAHQYLTSLGAGNGTFVAAQPVCADLADATTFGIAVMQATTPVGVPPGAIMDFAMPTAPAGWLECNGAAISRTTYAALFAAIGGYWGVGDGSTTFNLPDFRGAFRRGWDHGRGLDVNTSSRTFASYEADGFKSHTHSVSDPGHTHGVGDPGHAHGGVITGLTTGDLAPQAGGFGLASGGTAAAGTGIWIGAAATNISITANGSNETAPRNYAVLPCIKY